MERPSSLLLEDFVAALDEEQSQASLQKASSSPTQSSSPKKKHAQFSYSELHSRFGMEAFAAQARRSDEDVRADIESARRAPLLARTRVSRSKY